ncbi:hypothetical protein ACFV29_42530 [Streptomyces sp. NPDC059690]
MRTRTAVPAARERRQPRMLRRSPCARADGHRSATPQTTPG